MEEVEGEFGGVAGSGDADGDYRSSAVFFEEGAGWLEEEGFLAGYSLREFGLQARFGCVNVKGDDVAGLASGADDAAIGDDEGVEQCGADGMEVGVAVGAVNRCGEFGVQGNGAAYGVEGEIRRIGLALDFDLIELAGILSGGGESAADAGEWVEVSIVKAIVARDRREGGIIGVPGDEGAFGGDFAFGLGVGEGAVKIEQLSVAVVFH